MKGRFRSTWERWFAVYQRHLQTKAGEVTLKVPKLRTLPFETAIIERYRRRESSVEEAPLEMYLAGVSVVEDITEAPRARGSARAGIGAPSYNAQISTDAAHGLIVGVAVTQAAEDSGQLLPAVDRVQERLKEKPQQLVADGGYTTRENIEQMAEREIHFVGSMKWEGVPSGTSTPNRLPPSAFIYDRERDGYLCPEGKLLKYDCRHTKQSGLVMYRYSAETRDCQSCTRKPECGPGNQKRGRSVMRFEESALVVAFRKKMATEEARAQYRRRSQVAEFAHAWIKNKLGPRQFHVRGLEKVQMEMLWACFTYNLQHWIRLNKLRTAAAIT